MTGQKEQAMRIGTPGFLGCRLTQARAARRIKSKSALARLLSTHASTISRWEDGSSSPDPDMLAILANVLHVRREFFFREIRQNKRPMFYRTLASSLKSDLDYQQVQLAWLQELSYTVEHYVDLPPVDIPDVLGGASYKQLRDEDLEEIALQLRRHWRLGEGPCTDVLALMERVGFIVGSIEIGTSKLDGLCSWSPFTDRPHVVLATDKMSFARRQMDAAHELAHAVLHKNVTAKELKDDLRSIESQAFRLASAFLMPGTTYPYQLQRISLAALVNAKERWRTSVKAQIKRLTDLNIISEDHQRDLYKLYSSKGWNGREPFDREWAVTEPTLISGGLKLIVESGVRTKKDLLDVEFVISAGDIENLACLPPGWFYEKVGPAVQLKDRFYGGGVVIPFKRPS